MIGQQFDSNFLVRQYLFIAGKAFRLSHLEQFFAGGIFLEQRQRACEEDCLCGKLWNCVRLREVL